METGSTHLHVVPSLDRGWTLRELADGPAVRRTSTRRGVLEHATTLLARGTGGLIDVHAVDGTVLETYEVTSAGTRPWWYQRPRWLAALVAALFVVEGVLWLSGPTSVPRVLAVVGLGLGGFSLVSLAVSAEADRRLGPLRRRLPTPAAGTDDVGLG